jgi:ABC-type dipeptide/oligopeptide/nickel transport system ATPase component
VFLYGATGLRQILGGVDLEVRPGRALALLGESGSGKTLLIHSVLGLHGGVPGIVAGNATLLGVDLFRGLWDLVDYEQGPPPRIWKDCTRWHRALGRRLAGVLGRSVTLVPQDSGTALSPFHSVGRMLEAAVRVGRPGISRREARKEAWSWLERVHIYGVADVMGRYAHELSGGMAQRVALALALAPGPGLLVADEPTTGLDATLRVRILELLGHLNESYGATLFLITHDTEAARLLAQDAAILCAGRIVEAGPTAVVLDPTARPKHPHTRFLLEAEQRLGGSRIDAPFPSPAWECPADDDGYRSRCPVAGPECGGACPELRPVGQNHQLACRKEAF